MSTARTLVSAGPETVAGLVALALFAILFTLGAVGVWILAITGVHGRSVGLWAGAVVLTLAALLLGRHVWHGVGSFRTVEIGTDGSWTLKGPFGNRIAVLAPGDMRAVDVREKDVWFITGSVHRNRVAWLAIELPDGRIFNSLRSTPARQNEAAQALRAGGGGR